jgi:hypothetical protein
VVTTDNRSHDSVRLVKAAGAAKIFDRVSQTIYEDLRSHGPYKVILGVSESAANQAIIVKLLESQGGGRFLTTMGVKLGDVLPKGVEAFSIQYKDYCFKPRVPISEGYRHWN